MPRYRKIIKSGAVTEIEEYESIRTSGKRIPRSKNKNSTDEEQRERNRVNAQKHMCRLINANFGKNDLFYDLTYKGKEITREQAERDLDNFVERLRYHCKKRGIRMPKYVAVTENEFNREGRIHHHIVMQRVPMELIFDLWTKGNVGMQRVDPDSDYSGLANYISKEEPVPHKKRWKQSRGLKKPIVTKTLIVGRKQTERKIPCPKGYRVIERKMDYREETGMWQYAKFIKIGGMDFGMGMIC